MKIDFTKLKTYVSLDRSKAVDLDVHKDFAELIYQRGSGISAHSLALKIYNAKGEEEYSDEEVCLIRKYAESLGTPMFIDAIKEATETK